MFPNRHAKAEKIEIADGGEVIFNVASPQPSRVKGAAAAVAEMQWRIAGRSGVSGAVRQPNVIALRAGTIALPSDCTRRMM